MRCAHTALIPIFNFQFQLKVHFYECLSSVGRSLTVSAWRRFFFQVHIWRDVRKRGYTPCPGAAVQGTRFWAIGLTLSDRGHAKNVPFLGELFQASYAFRVIDPRTLPKPAKGAQILFLGKRLLNRKISKFRQDTIHANNDSRFLPTFVEIGKTKATKSVRYVRNKTRSLETGRQLRISL